MADEYRQGRKSVHRGTRYRPELDVEQIPGCFIDPTVIDWSPVKPPGPICTDCFGMGGQAKGNRPGIRGAARSTLAGTAAAIAVVAVAFAASLDEPMNIFGPYPSGSVRPIASATPGPASVPPTASSAPALTLPPTTPPFVLPTAPTYPPIPTWPPIPTYPPVPTFGPLPTFNLPPLPTLAPLPTILPIPCVHPGTHLGVDPCKWPHN